MDQAPSQLRILHLTTASEAGGLSRYIYDLSAAMCQQGHEAIVAGARGAWHDLFETAPFPWIQVPLNGGLLDLWKARRELSRRIAGKKFDVIHTHYRRATLVGRWLQRQLGAPLLYTVHLSHIKLGWPRRWRADFGDHVHVASEHARQWVIESGHVPANRVTLILHGIHLDRFPRATPADQLAARQRFGLAPNHRVASYVGRLDYPKNVDWLIDVAQASREQLPQLRILIAGDGPDLAPLRQRITACSLADRVVLAGELRDPLPVYQASDALLLPSLREGFSLASAEAMAVGVPVLRTRTAGTRELIVEGQTGRSTEIERGAFVSQAIRFLADGQALAQMSQLAARHVRDHFSFERQLLETIALYQQMKRENVKT